MSALREWPLMSLCGLNVTECALYIQRKQKWAENTLKELYGKKKELKFERAAVDQQRERFKRMEREYNEFVIERKRMRTEKQCQLRRQQKLTVTASNQKREIREMASKLDMFKDRIQCLEKQNKVWSSCLSTNS